jgi:hypothetical protein
MYMRTLLNTLHYDNVINPKTLTRHTFMVKHDMLFLLCFTSLLVVVRVTLTQ